MTVLLACAVAFAQLGPTTSLGQVRALVARRFPEVRRIDAGALAAAMSVGGATAPLLLDTRTEAEFAVSHLRGALRLDPSRPLRAQVGDRRERPIVVYCSVGYRSAIVARSLAQVGVRDVQNLDGGIFAWANEGRAVFRNGEPVREVHPYDAVWGVLLRGDLRGSAPRR
ncbi:MAG: rhodanese-like domain-containing protein [Myxococcaceae bacterium]|nr:MAG: rhodanese-like domain-containing protein [Myxococcaceae bacterium]